jgi:uncharacterized membrane protein YfcA
MGVSLDPAGWGLLLLIGFFCGLATGLLGNVGRVMVAPALLIALPSLGIGGPEVVKIAAATAIAVFIPLAIAEFSGKRSGIDWDLYTLLAPSIAVGAVIATTFVDEIDGRLLAALLSATVAIIAINLFRTFRESSYEQEAKQDPELVRMTLHTVAEGAAAALLGMVVPMGFAFARSRANPTAIATASALGLPLSLAATAGYFLGHTPAACGRACAGYVFVPGAAAIGMGMVLTAPIGGKLARFLPKVWLRKLFAVVLFAAAAGIFLSQLPIRGFLAGRQDSLQELLLGPLCDPPPAPAAPAFDTNASRSER